MTQKDPTIELWNPLILCEYESDSPFQKEWTRRESNTGLLRAREVS